jgi:hypothetical protein
LLHRRRRRLLGDWRRRLRARQRRSLVRLRRGRLLGNGGRRRDVVRLRRRRLAGGFFGRLRLFRRRRRGFRGRRFRLNVDDHFSRHLERLRRQIRQRRERGDVERDREDDDDRA